MSKQNKTVPTTATPELFLENVSKKEREQALRLIAIFEKVSKKRCVMWGNIFGFGEYHYLYESGREGDSPATGFALRKNAIVIYILPGYQDYEPMLKNIGPHKLGKSCLYIKSLEDIDVSVLEKLIRQGLIDLNKKYKVK